MFRAAPRWVEDIKTQSITAMSAPKVHVDSFMKPRKLFPKISTFMRCPWAPELGLTELTVGGGGGPLEVTEKPLPSVPL
jgi:hypothetical protein